MCFSKTLFIHWYCMHLSFRLFKHVDLFLTIVRAILPIRVILIREMTPSMIETLVYIYIYYFLCRKVISSTEMCLYI